MKKFLSIFFIISSFVGFYFAGTYNYSKYREIEEIYVNHPNFIPKTDFAKVTAFGYSNLKSDYYWLSTIQYIGSNAIGSKYKKYLFKMTDLITDLNPYFERPYIIAQLLLPNSNARYEKDLTNEDELRNIKEGINIGLKGVKNFCDKEKVDAILKEEDLQTLFTDPKYRNPCRSYNPPYYLAFIYHFYDKNPKEASKYYKIAGLNDESPSGAKILAAIMEGKGGDREKSALMFITLSKSLPQDRESCTAFAPVLEGITLNLYAKKLALNENLIRAINEDKLTQISPFKREENGVINDDCSLFLNKAIRELNAKYIEDANKKFFLDKGFNAQNPDILYEEGYIGYRPVDFQQYEKYGIDYIWDEDTNSYDYKIDYERRLNQEDYK